MDFRNMTAVETVALRDALRRNVSEGAALCLDTRDTTFIGVDDTIPDGRMIQAVASVPCHY